MAANVKSIESIREFRGNLIDYRDAIRQSLDILCAELVRAIDYFESDRAAYWPAQVRKASDRLAEARINLERCQVTTRPGEGPSCVDEKKALQRAKARLYGAQAKVKATRRWIQMVRKEVDDFQTRLSQLRYLLDYELPRAATVLERLATRLDHYVERLGHEEHTSPS